MITSMLEVLCRYPVFLVYQLFCLILQLNQRDLQAYDSTIKSVTLESPQSYYNVFKGF